MFGEQYLITQYDFFFIQMVYQFLNLTTETSGSWMVQLKPVMSQLNLNQCAEIWYDWIRELAPDPYSFRNNAVFSAIKSNILNINSLDTL